MKVEKLIKLAELDSNFKYEISKMPEGKMIFYCFQCGTCTASCPVADIADIKPHQVIRMALLGMREKVLSCKMIWLCSTCFTCLERCPQDVEPPNVFFALKNIAAREKGVPEGIKALVQNIYKFGRSAEVTELEDEDREALDIPKVPSVNVEAFRTIMEKTGLNKLLETKEGAGG